MNLTNAQIAVMAAALVYAGKGSSYGATSFAQEFKEFMDAADQSEYEEHKIRFDPGARPPPDTSWLDPAEEVAKHTRY